MIETEEIIFPLADDKILLEIVTNVEDLITDPKNEDKIPTWAELWPSARGLATHLWDRVELRNKTVLELGTGLGLPGLTCGKKGALVTFSDFIPEALKMAKKNAAKNNISNYKTLLADWRDFPNTNKYDLIVGSDIFYNPLLNPYLVNIVSSCLSEKGELIVAHPGRPDTFEFVKEVENKINFQEEKTEKHITIDDINFPHYTVHIHYLKRK